MQRLEVSGAVRPLYGSLGVKGLIYCLAIKCSLSTTISSYFLDNFRYTPAYIPGVF